MAKDNKIFTPADQAAVVIAIAGGATIAAAAKAAGFAVQTLYNSRARCALFRQSWDAAVEESSRPVLVAPRGGRRWQARRMRRNWFSRERKAVFLGHLAVSCDVTASAFKAGVCVATVYAHRRSDPAFAAAWETALESGYFLLESEAVRQRLEGQERFDFEPGDLPDPRTKLESDLEFWRTLHLLREHKRGLAGFGKAGRPPRVASNAEVRAALIRQMKAMGIIPRGEAIA